MPETCEAMTAFLLGRKGRMTQVFTPDGGCIPVTILEAGPCKITQVKTPESDGYSALQLAFQPVREKVVTKPLRGHFAKAKVAPHRVLRETRLEEAPEASLGDEITCAAFANGDVVDISGLSKGRGTAGGMKRHGFSGRPASHGHMRHRRPGSLGQHADPSRVFPGKRMAGRHGNTRHTARNLVVVHVDLEKNIILVKGAVPGPRGGVVEIRTARTAKKG